jgi:aspartyl-tRNA(Asn)/glutamyl-tRNA(Gln) amidotransferase subunit C
MSLNIQDIEKLADLARIEVSDAEKQSLLEEMTSILGYVSDIQSAANDSPEIEHTHTNITRPDVSTITADTYTEKILNNAPVQRDGYIQVDQVLEQ